MIFILLWISIICKSQVRAGLGMGYADSLFMNGQYYAALIEYERVIYRSGDDAVTAEAIIKKANCYKQLTRFDKALMNLKRQDPETLPPELKNGHYYEKALCAYLINDYDQAKWHIGKIDQINSPELLNNYSLLKTLIYNELAEWDRARESALAYAGSVEADKRTRDSLSHLIDSLYCPENLPGLKNARSAKILSAILPGAGQAYAGKPVDGLFSLVLCSSSVVLSVYLFQSSLFFTGLFGGIGLFQRFYFGGIRRTDFLINEKNNERIRNFNEQAEKILFSYYESIKCTKK